MTDQFTKEKRSEIMSKIKSRGSALEKAGFDILRLAGLRYRKHPEGVYGNPDAANKSKKIAVFFDSNFWHGYKYKQLKKELKKKYWRDKIERNMRRDVEVGKYLRKKGWRVIRFWEHEVFKKPAICTRRVKSVL